MKCSLSNSIVLMVVVALPRAFGFLPRVSSTVSTARKQLKNDFQSRSTDLKYSIEEESEWYTPPPAPKQDLEEELGLKLPRGVTPKVTVIRSKIDFDEFLAAEDDRLCVVKFHAAWCKSCQKFNLLFGKISAQYADWEKQGQLVKEGKVRIAEVEWGANTQLCKSLGVKKLPSLYFYSGGMKISSLAAGPSTFSKVREAVKRYSGMSMAELQFEAELERGKKLMEEAARKERFEEVAKARQQRRAASGSSRAGIVSSKGTSADQPHIDRLRNHLNL